MAIIECSRVRVKAQVQTTTIIAAVGASVWHCTSESVHMEGRAKSLIQTVCVVIGFISL